jgi:hypothetical protein
VGVFGADHPYWVCFLVPLALGRFLAVEPRRYHASDMWRSWVQRLQHSVLAADDREPSLES